VTSNFHQAKAKGKERNKGKKEDTRRGGRKLHRLKEKKWGRGGTRGGHQRLPHVGLEIDWDTQKVPDGEGL